MSWKASAYVLDLAKAYPWLTVTHLAVLYALGARHHQDDHCAWGQLPRIMEDTHASESTVSHALAELEEKGVLSVWEGQYPRRKNDPSDRRRTRGLFFCFVGLDPDDGPAYEGLVRHVRRGGRSNSVANAATDLVAPHATQFLTDDSNSVAAETEIGCEPTESELQTSQPTSDMSCNAATPGPAGRPDRAGLKTGLNPAPPISPPQAGGDLEIKANGDGRDPRETSPDPAFAADVWRGALERLRASVSPEHFEAYLAATRAVSFDVDSLHLVLETANPFHVPWLLGKLAGPIDLAVSLEVGCPVRVDWQPPRQPAVEQPRQLQRLRPPSQEPAARNGEDAYEISRGAPN